MTLTKIIALSALGTGLAFSAMATTPDNTFTVAFEYNSKAPAEVIYDDFRTTANRACRTQISTRPVTPRHYSELRECVSELLGKAVLETGNTTLVALHESKEGNN